MDRWALEFAERAAFICVGCAGSSLASTFVRDLKLKHTSVTYCAESDMPSWGQLGCGGFIVLDGAGKVAHAKTSAFMQVRDLAFRHSSHRVGHGPHGSEVAHLLDRLERACEAEVSG